MARLSLPAFRGGFVSGSLVLVGGVAVVFFAGLPAFSQAITISTKPTETTDRRYAQIQPTNVELPQQQIDARGHQAILRILIAEQGFAMRPLPRGKKGLSLAANGKLTPAGEGYVSSITDNGLSVKPGDRVVLSNVRIDKERIVFDLNGGPERKHAFMRHVQIGVGGPSMTAPVIQDQGEEPTGARVTLTFSKFVPDVTPAQVKALLAPLISFDVKTPVQAYTDTLPPRLKDAILNHHVMVGMSTDMVLFALGPPEAKSREVEGQMPFEEWIYGHPPQDVSFVRVNGNRVIRVEIAKLGQPLEIFTKDEVEGLMTTDGHPVLAQAATHEQRTVQLGDAHRDPDKQAPAVPPTLRAPGEKLPIDQPSVGSGAADPTISREGPMKPVIFPKDTTNAPARTVLAHPNPTKADDPNKANPTESDPDKSSQDKPKAKPDSAPPPSSNFYSGKPQPAML
jgi:hypothetical protein